MSEGERQLTIKISIQPSQNQLVLFGSAHTLRYIPQYIHIYALTGSVVSNKYILQRIVTICASMFLNPHTFNIHCTHDTVQCTLITFLTSISRIYVNYFDKHNTAAELLSSWIPFFKNLNEMNSVQMKTNLQQSIWIWYMPILNCNIAATSKR